MRFSIHSTLLATIHKTTSNVEFVVETVKPAPTTQWFFANGGLKAEIEPLLWIPGLEPYVTEILEQDYFLDLLARNNFLSKIKRQNKTFIQLTEHGKKGISESKTLSVGRSVGEDIVLNEVQFSASIR